MTRYISDLSVGLFNFLLCLLFVGCSYETNDTPLVFVRDGTAVAVIEDFNGWQRQEGYLEGTSRSNMLFAPKLAMQGDFEINIEMSVHDFDTRPACFIGLGNLHFYIDCSQSGRQFYLNEHSTGEKVEITNTMVSIKDGVPFNLALIKSGDILSYVIDGVTVHKHILADSVVGKFGIYPVRAASSSLRLYEFSASGNLADMPEDKILTPVFKRGEGGYNTFRIPALILLKKGTLLAICEGRRNSREDYGEIDLVLKRSHDLGETWDELELLYSEGGNTGTAFSCPTPFVEESTGAVHLMITHDAHRILHMYSTDEGNTWTTPRDITSTAENFETTWHRIATSPGHAIQLKHAPYAGRVVVPLWLNDTIADKYVSAIIYSDDGGENWVNGGLLVSKEYSTSESQTVELADGSLLQNLRVEDKTINHRAFSKSRNGGITWSELGLQKDFPVRVCGGSMVRIKDATLESGDLLVSSNPASLHSRARLTLCWSDNGGETWPYSSLIHLGPSAMSDMVVLPDGSIGCLYEAGYHFAYEMITYERFVIGDL